MHQDTRRKPRSSSKPRQQQGRHNWAKTSRSKTESTLHLSQLCSRSVCSGALPSPSITVAINVQLAGITKNYCCSSWRPRLTTSVHKQSCTPAGASPWRHPSVKPSCKVIPLRRDGKHRPVLHSKARHREAFTEGGSFRMKVHAPADNSAC